MIGSKEKLVWCPFITRKTAQWHPEIGYHEAFCDYWQEINWNER